MREFRIFSTGSEYLVSVLRDDEQLFRFNKIPTEIETDVTNILQFCNSLKTEQEIAAKKAADYIAQNATEEQQLEMKYIFAELRPGMKAEEGKKYRIGDDLVVVDMAHEVTEESLEKRPATFYRVIGDANKPDEIPDWRQPKGNADAWMEGDKVKWTDGNIYVSKVNFNLKSPEESPIAWDLWEEGI